MTRLPTSFKNQLLRRWLVPFALSAYTAGALNLGAEDVAPKSTAELTAPQGTASSTPPPSDSPAPSFVPLARTLALRDTDAGESATALAAASSSEVSSTAPPAAPAPSPNAMVNLVNLLVAQHVITKAAAMR